MYYDLLQKIETELKNDDFITTVTEGNIFDIDMTKITLFPLAHVQVTNATFNENVISFNIKNIHFYDLKIFITSHELRGRSIPYRLSRFDDVYFSLIWNNRR